MSQHWKFYESMSVSKDATTTKKMICNIPETNQFLNKELPPIVQGNYSINNLDTDFASQLYEDDRSPSRKRQIMNNTLNDYPNASNERQMIQKLNNANEKNCEDENFQFLMSLLPYLRDIPKHRKLLIRTKLQKVFMDEQERCNLDSNHCAPDTQSPSRPPPPYPYPKTDFNFAAPHVPVKNKTAAEEQSNDIMRSPTSQKSYSQNCNGHNLIEHVEPVSWTTY